MSVENLIRENIRTNEEIKRVYGSDEHGIGGFDIDKETQIFTPGISSTRWRLKRLRKISEPNFCREHVIRSPRHRNAGDHHYRWNLSSLLVSW